MPKILFVSSGNSQNGISSIVANQGESLKKAGIWIDFFTILGKGIKGYVRNIVPLKIKVQKNKYDLIHAHYSLSAFIASFAGCSPLSVSLMGSDIQLGRLIQFAIKFSSVFLWDAVIVKSRDMASQLNLEKVEIIPNGVNTDLFRPSDRGRALKALGWNPEKKHILFAANPTAPVKNFNLFQEAYQILPNSQKNDVHYLKEVPHQDVPLHINASDLLVLTSLREGSPNVIKEAMACNRPVVATNVGDVARLFGDAPGHFLIGFEAQEVSQKIQMALNFAEQNGKTAGRERIMELGLDSKTIAERIIKVYESILNKHA